MSECFFTGGCSDMSPSDCQRVVHSGKLYEVVSHLHNSTGHGSRKKVLAAAHRDYYGMPRSYVEQFCRTCPTCQKAAPNTTKAPLKPIVDTEFLNRIQIDLIDTRHSPDNCYHYICHGSLLQIPYHLPSENQDCARISY